MEIDKHQVDIEREAVSLSYPADFDAELVRKFIEAVRKMHNTTQYHRDIEVLQYRRLGVINKDNVFVPNMAFALVFARDPLQLCPGCEVRFMRFEGEIEQSGSN